MTLGFTKLRGFTLIELMIAVAIIGILVAVGFPQYQNYVARAQVAEALVLASGAKTAVAEYFNTTGDVPADNKAAGLPEDPKDINGKYVDSVEIGGGEAAGIINVVLSSDAHPKIAGGILSLVPELDKGFIWYCAGFVGDLDITSYLPSSCADPEL